MQEPLLVQAWNFFSAQIIKSWIAISAKNYNEPWNAIDNRLENTDAYTWTTTYIIQ